MKRKRSIQCALCKNFFKNSEMSEEHYPAKSTGNDDIVALDFGKMIDSIMSGKVIEFFFSRRIKEKHLKKLVVTFLTRSFHTLFILKVEPHVHCVENAILSSVNMTSHIKNSMTMVDPLQ